MFSTPKLYYKIVLQIGDLTAVGKTSIMKLIYQARSFAVNNTFDNLNNELMNSY